MTAIHLMGRLVKTLALNRIRIGSKQGASLRKVFSRMVGSQEDMFLVGCLKSSRIRHTMLHSF